MIDRAAIADPWTIYWQADHLHSCISAGSPEDAKQLAEYWVRFGRTLPKGARLIDLATGNGAVPFALAQAGLDLRITAVDQAYIDPRRYLKAAQRLQGVRFLGGTDLREAPALGGPYDAVTSQFGLEYLPADRRPAVVARLLSRGGHYQFLMHHAASEVVAPASRDLEELAVLLEPGGLLATLRAFSERSTSAQSLADRAKEYLGRQGRKTRRLSGQVITAVQTSREAHGSGAEACFDMATETFHRVAAERERLRQLTQAALTEAGAASLTAGLGAAGLVVDRLEPFHVGGGRYGRALVGWQLAGHNRAVPRAGRAS